MRWYLRFSLSLQDVEELMAKRGLSVDHTTIWRLTQTYAPEVQRRLQGQLKPRGSTWHIDETFVRISARCMYLFRAVDSGGQTVDFYLSENRDREAAKCLLKRALANPDNRPPHIFARDDCEVIQPPFENCRTKAKSIVVVATELAPTQIIASNPTTVM